ncbi:hypothetical protein JWG44_09075 [Leptospira sp. 201903071]|uniref:LA_2444/LA_4059 family outer membrane protein n=1 Tax=Leptospira ainazelensis TaxID=2810034 RepID=UPI0019664B81|nr:LA_2444/LA_4059 family outer membrane protein [Leptospira ainazelensis]MBM9500396.1 hypothetical protein [Leptospira ainazelensis]
MRKNRIRSLFQKESSWTWTILTVIFLSWNSLPAQTKEESDLGEKKKTSFELLIKRQTYQWTPYDYTSYSEHSPLENSIKTESVKQNQKVLIPLTFRYDNSEKKFRIEISAYEVELANANMNVTRTVSGDFQVRRQYLNPMMRSESEFNYYKILNLTPDWKLFAGMGIRNINKYKYGYFLREGAYQEYFYTYGPQIVLNTEYKLWKEISVHMSFDLFYTQGNRFYKEQTLFPDSITVSNGNAGVKGIYRGYEIDFSLSYKLLEAVKFFAGYNYIYSYFSYYGFKLTDFNLVNSSIDPFRTTTGNPPLISQPIRSGNHEILQGFYLGVSVGF